jgi:hypothetical protein
MKKIILTIALIGISFGINSQNFDSLTAAGSNKKIEWTTSTWGSGFGHKIYSSDPGGKTLLNIASRNNNSNWTDLMTFTSDNKVGIGTTNPLAKLHIETNKWQNSLLTLKDTHYSPHQIYHFQIESDGLKIKQNNTINYQFKTGGNFIVNNGNLGIGTTNPDEKLTVKGKIHAEEVRVDLQVPADYVFQKYYTGASLLKETYKMPTLEEVAAFTKKNHHLPEIPSATQIQKEGLHLKQMTNLLLQKIEELTIYTIEQEKRINALESKLVGKKS